MMMMQRNRRPAQRDVGTSLFVLLLSYWTMTPAVSFTFNNAVVVGKRGLLQSSSFACGPVVMIQSKRRGQVGGGALVASSSPLLLSSLASSLKSDEEALAGPSTETPATATLSNNINEVTIDNTEITERPPSSSSTVAAYAATNTINERLLAELQEAEQKERFGPRSKAGQKMSLVDGFGRRRKTDEEIKAAIAEARDLNGVNPFVAIGGSFFAFGVATVLWITTNKLGIFFAMHPPETDVYFVIRAAQVFRNVMMGLISLASGFFGVTGLGIFLLGVRVAYGVAIGELDPTPIKKTPSLSSSKDDVGGVDFSNVWDLMMNKKPGRKG